MLKRKCSGHGITRSLTQRRARSPIIQRRVNSHAPCNQDSFWLLELLKSCFMDAAAPYIIQGSKDRKDVCLQPRSFELSRSRHDAPSFVLSVVLNRYQTRYLGIATASPNIYQHREQALKVSKKMTFLRKSNLTALLMDLRSVSTRIWEAAYATMNVAIYQSPILATSYQDARGSSNSAANHQRTLQISNRFAITKERRDQKSMELLRFYRDFLSDAI